MVYFTAMGFVLHFTGQFIYQNNGIGGTTASLLFAGSFIACLFWVSHTDTHKNSWREESLTIPVMISVSGAVE